MKTTVVPAQITTVEDRIAGNFTFSQILLLMVPLITSTATYALLGPRMHLSILKVILVGVQVTFFGLLAIRVNGKIVAEWLAIILRFTLRPKRYVFTKNDSSTRAVVSAALGHELAVVQKVAVPKKAALAHLPFDQLRIVKLLSDPKLNLRFERSEKGGLNVSLTKG